MEIFKYYMFNNCGYWSDRFFKRKERAIDELASKIIKLQIDSTGYPIEILAQIEYLKGIYKGHAFYDYNRKLSENISNNGFELRMSFQEVIKYDDYCEAIYLIEYRFVKRTAKKIDEIKVPGQIYFPSVFSVNDDVVQDWMPLKKTGDNQYTTYGIDDWTGGMEKIEDAIVKYTVYLEEIEINFED